MKNSLNRPVFDIKTATVDDVARYTGHSKQKLSKAKIQRSARNKELLLVSSLIEWLKSNPVSTAKVTLFPVNSDLDTETLDSVTV